MISHEYQQTPSFFDNLVVSNDIRIENPSQCRIERLQVLAIACLKHGGEVVVKTKKDQEDQVVFIAPDALIQALRQPVNNLRTILKTMAVKMQNSQEVVFKKPSGPSAN